MKIKKKRFVTLIEMMIVMLLIAMIIGAVAYNYQGSLDKGRAFKTEMGIKKIETILALHLIDHPESEETFLENWKDYVRQSPLVQNPEELLKDGWGQEYQVFFNEEGELVVRSEKYEKYKKNR